MDLFEALYTTRAMRRMRPDPIPDELLVRMLDAAIRAPTAGGRERWRFVIVRNRAAKSELGRLFAADVAAARAGVYADLERRLREQSAAAEVVRYGRMIRSVDHLVRHFSEIPVLVSCWTQDGDTLVAGGSIFPAAWSLQLAARGLGVGSVPIGSLSSHQREIRGLLSVPDDESWVMATCIALGYPTGRWGIARRRPVGEVTFLERWGRPITWPEPDRIAVKASSF